MALILYIYIYKYLGNIDDRRESSSQNNGRIFLYGNVKVVLFFFNFLSVVVLNKNSIHLKQ